MKKDTCFRCGNPAPEDFLCDGCLQEFQKVLESWSIQFPIEVKKIKRREDPPIRECRRLKTGDLAAVRPCDDRKTYLGIYIGDIPLRRSVRYNTETKELEVVREQYNPAFLVPERKRVIFGMESWWGKIKSEEQLREITDETIQNQWYVRALKQMAGEV